MSVEVYIAQILLHELHSQARGVPRVVSEQADAKLQALGLTSPCPHPVDAFFRPDANAPMTWRKLTPEGVVMLYATAASCGIPHCTCKTEGAYDEYFTKLGQGMAEAMTAAMGEKP